MVLALSCIEPFRRRLHESLAMLHKVGRRIFDVEAGDRVSGAAVGSAVAGRSEWPGVQVDN